ncbi:MAG: hypothetical protein PHH06_05470 [Candidatus Gracilibacteria bacterium]|nr:hypothetical protein [Candidatus Gracilibacteria bacterium]
MDKCIKEISQTFWNTDTDQLPGAIKINAETTIIYQGITSQQSEISKGVYCVLNN